MPVITNSFAMGEMLAVLLSRDMADGEKAIVGTNSDIQVAACNLARARQAPHLWWVSGPGGMTNPTEGIVRPAAGSVQITWTSVPGIQYEVLATTSIGIAFSAISGPTPIPAAGATTSYTDTTSAGRKFYRIRVVTP